MLRDGSSSMNMWAIIGAGLATIIALIVATFLVAGAEPFWRLFGEPDLGPVSFEQLERRATPNDSLACPPDFCKARVDVTTRLYPVTAHELRLVFAKVIASEPRVSLAEANDAALTDRYIQRSAHLGCDRAIERMWSKDRCTRPNPPKERTVSKTTKGPPVAAPGLPAQAVSPLL